MLPRAQAQNPANSLNLTDMFIPDVNMVLILLSHYKTRGESFVQQYEERVSNSQKSQKREAMSPKCCQAFAAMLQFHMEKMPYPAVLECYKTFEFFGARDCPFMDVAQKRMDQFGYHGDPQPGRQEAPRKHFGVRKVMHVQSG